MHGRGSGAGKGVQRIPSQRFGDSGYFPGSTQCGGKSEKRHRRKWNDLEPGVRRQVLEGGGRGSVWNQFHSGRLPGGWRYGGDPGGGHFAARREPGKNVDRGGGKKESG